MLEVRNNVIIIIDHRHYVVVWDSSTECGGIVHE